MTDDGALVRGIDAIRTSDRPTVGGKAASLGELTGAGVPVPPGFVVTTAGFTRVIATVDPDLALRRQLEDVAADDTTVDRAAGTLRERITAAELPADVRDAIVEGYATLDPDGDAPVAVRSSATSEDSSDASFAGLQDTYLWIRGSDAVLTHVRRCWASLYNVESVAYRRLRLELPEAGLAMAVVVQRMVDARVSGVMFTCSPVSGDRSVVSIEASWGLGSAMVSGVVTPDAWVVNTITDEIVSREIADKAVRHDRDETGGVVQRDVPDHERSKPCLSDERVRELAHVGRDVERHYGTPQDIEWAMPAVDGTPGPIRVLQSRPETVWSARERAPAATPRERPYDHVLDLLAGGRRTTTRDDA